MDKRLLLDSERPNWEYAQVVVGAFLAVMYAAAAMMLPAWRLPLIVCAAMLGCVAIAYYRPARRRQRFLSKSTNGELSFCTYAQAAQKCVDPAHAEDVWLGECYPWQSRNCQQAQEILRKDWQSHHAASRLVAEKKRIFKERPLWNLLHYPTYLRTVNEQIKRVASYPGYGWIQNLEPAQDCYMPVQVAQGHSLILGTTGAGKTQTLSFLIFQEICRKPRQAVIVIDLKGDEGIERSMREACHESGRECDFRMLQMARPESSMRLDFCANAARPSDIASRFADAVPDPGGQSRPFIEMARGHLTKICNGLALIGRKPSPKALLHHFRNRVEFAELVLREYIATQRSIGVAPEGFELKSAFLKDLGAFYRRHCNRVAEVDAVIELAEIDAQFLQKTTSSMSNLLELLTTGDVGRLFSPDEETDRIEPLTDLRKLIDQRAVVFIGLDALSNSGLARAVGSLLMADLAALAGARYAHERNMNKVAIFIDECSELATEPFVQMLNKARGAGFRMTIASQTIADFTEKLGSKAAQERVLANVNVLLALRTLDAETQQFFSDRCGKTTTQMAEYSTSTAATSQGLLASTKVDSFRVKETEAPLLPAMLLGALPTCHFFGLLSGGYLVKGQIPILVDTLPKAAKGKRNGKR